MGPIMSQRPCDLSPRPMMTKKQIVPAVVLALCGVAIVYGFVLALAAAEGMPFGLIIAAPAIVVGRFAWQRMWPQKVTRDG